MRWAITILASTILSGAVAQDSSPQGVFLAPITPIPLPSSTAFLCAPKDDLTAAAVKLLDSARSEILISATALTDPDVVRAVLTAYSERKVAVHLLLEAAPDVTDYRLPALLAKMKVPAIWLVMPSGINASNFAIIDRQAVLCGSYSFGVNARRNFEQLLILTEPAIVTSYYNAFVRQAVVDTAFATREAALRSGHARRSAHGFSRVNGLTSEDVP